MWEAERQRQSNYPLFFSPNNHNSQGWTWELGTQSGLLHGWQEPNHLSPYSSLPESVLARYWCQKLGQGNQPQYSYMGGAWLRCKLNTCSSYIILSGKNGYSAISSLLSFVRIYWIKLCRLHAVIELEHVFAVRVNIFVYLFLELFC